MESYDSQSEVKWDHLELWVLQALKTPAIYFTSEGKLYKKAPFKIL